MTRMNPLRRLAASAAILGVTAFGGVALASPALADDSTTPAATSSSTAVDSSDLLAGLFSKQKAVGSVDLPKEVTLGLGDIMSARNDSDPAHQSPLPTGAVQFKISGLKLTLPAQVAQPVQSVIASFYAAQGYQVTFSEKTGVLVIGKKLCNPTKPMTDKANKDCVVLTPDGGRF
jgi:hypothetical protein